MQDFKEMLGVLRETMVEEIQEINIDTVSIVEDANPELTKESKKYRDSNKIIFKEDISKKNSNQLVSLVVDIEKYSVNNLYEYKEQILNRCNIIYAQGENPIEMLVYATKGIAGKDIYINAIRDLIKTLYEDNQELVIRAYRNILNNWNWNDCITFVLRSITELKIKELSKEIYPIFEENNINRQLAAFTIISLEEDSLFENIINFLCVQSNATNAETDMARSIMYYMVKQVERSTIIIYKCYLKLSVSRHIAGIMIGAIRFNLDRVIIEHIQKNLKNDEIPRHITRKMIELLGKCKQNGEEVVEILINALEYSHLNKSEITRAIGGSIPEVQKKIITDKTKNIRERSEAIISMSNSEDESYEKILEEVACESDILDAVVCSVKVERGNNAKIIKLFEYIVTKDEYEEVSIVSTNQIKRLRSLRKPMLNQALLKVATSLLSNDDKSNIGKMIKIIDLFSSGIPTEEIGELFLSKLNSTKHTKIKEKIIGFYKKEYHRFGNELKAGIKESIIKCSKQGEVIEIAMDCLKCVNSYVDSTPTLGA